MHILNKKQSQSVLLWGVFLNGACFVPIKFITISPTYTPPNPRKWGRGVPGGKGKCLRLDPNPLLNWTCSPPPPSSSIHADMCERFKTNISFRGTFRNNFQALSSISSLIDNISSKCFFSHQLSLLYGFFSNGIVANLRNF